MTKVSPTIEKLSSSSREMRSEITVGGRDKTGVDMCKAKCREIQAAVQNMSHISYILSPSYRVR